MCIRDSLCTPFRMPHLKCAAYSRWVASCRTVFPTFSRSVSCLQFFGAVFGKGAQFLHGVQFFALIHGLGLDALGQLVEERLCLCARLKQFTEIFVGLIHFYHLSLSLAQQSKNIRAWELFLFQTRLRNRKKLKTRRAFYETAMVCGGAEHTSGGRFADRVRQ